MLQQIFLPEVALPTFGALKGLLASVFPVMNLEVVLAEESLVTGGTLNGLNGAPPVPRPSSL